MKITSNTIKEAVQCEHVSQKDTEIISLMIQFIENQLSENCSAQISDLISDCKECQKLFEEVQFFFDKKETFMYEMLNSEKIEKSRSNLQNIISTHSVQKKSNQIHSPFFDEDYYDIITGGCSCCD